MSTKSGQHWDEVAKERRAAQRRENNIVIVNLAVGTCWTITILYGLFLYTHNRYADLLGPMPEVPVSWTLFTYGMIGNLITFSVVVTILYLVVRIHYIKENMNP